MNELPTTSHGLIAVFVFSVAQILTLMIRAWIWRQRNADLESWRAAVEAAPSEAARKWLESSPPDPPPHLGLLMLILGTGSLWAILAGEARGEFRVAQHETPKGAQIATRSQVEHVECMTCPAGFLCLPSISAMPAVADTMEEPPAIEAVCGSECTSKPGCKCSASECKCAAADRRPPDLLPLKPERTRRKRKPQPAAVASNPMSGDLWGWWVQPLETFPIRRRED